MKLGIIILGILVTLLVIVYVIRNRGRAKKGWQIQKSNNSEIRYFELIDQEFQSISFKEERYAQNVPRHGILIPKDWSDFPEWASTNRNEIIERIQQELKSPEYTILWMD